MAFWKKFYKSKYTGAEIDAAVAKAGDATKVTANPTLTGTEAALTGLEVGETKYKVEQPINVVANPTLAGTEAALTGLEVGDTKYKVGGLPVIQFTQVELASILTAFMTHIIGATDKLTYKQFTITGDVVAGMKEKILSVTNSANRCGYLQIEGFDGNMFVCVGDDDVIQSIPVKTRGTSPATYYTQLWLLISIDTDSIRIDAYVQKVNAAT